MDPNSSLDTYLSDHLAGAAAGCELARRIAATHDDPTAVDELDALAADIEVDRDTLIEIRERLGFGPRPVRQAAGRIGEKLTRLRISDPVTRDPELTRLMEFETLAIGIEGKMALWRALAATVAPERITGIDLDVLSTRGERQRAIVERHRLAAAHGALEPTPRSDRAGMPIGARIADAVLEASVIGGHTTIGSRVRRRLEHWPDLPDLTGRTYVVTGATAGIGHEAADRLLEAGASVFSASRSAERAAAARSSLRASRPGADVDIAVADLTRPEDIDGFAARVRERSDRIDGLGHCAGAFFPEPTFLDSGVEANAAVYVLGPHQLTRALLDPLTHAAEPRVVFVSSSGAYASRMKIDDLDPAPDDYRPLAQYALAKRAQILLTHAWSAARPDIRFDAMTPGWCDTQLVRSGLPNFRRVFGPILRTPAEGADTLAWLLATDTADRPSNRLWRDRHTRLEHRLPWTALGDGPDEVWAWCEHHRSDAGRPQESAAARVSVGR